MYGGPDTVAADYYLSGIKIQPDHYACVHNLAICYFRIKKFCNACKWFKIATKIDPDCRDGYYALAAC